MEPGLTLFQSERQLNLFVQRFGASRTVSDILRLLLSDPGSSFTITELISWAGASRQETARSLELLSDTGLASIFRSGRQVRAYVSPLPLMQHLARQVVMAMRNSAMREAEAQHWRLEERS